MKNTILFFLRPAEFYRRIRNGQLRMYILYALVVYTVIYILWRVQVPDNLVEQESWIFFENEYLNVGISMLSDLGMSIGLAYIILLVSKIFRLRCSFPPVLLSVLSLSVISCLMMVSQLLLFLVTGGFESVSFFETLGFLWQMVYLFVGIKTIYTIPALKTIVLQAVSFAFLSLFLMGLIVGRNAVYPSRFTQGLEYLGKLDFDKAIKNFTYAIQRDSSNPKYQYYLGEACRQYLLFNPKEKHRRDVFEKGTEAFNKAIEIDSHFVDARLGLGLLYSIQGRFEDALSQFQIVLNSDPDNERANKEAGRIYLRLGKLEMAKKYFVAISTNKDETDFIQHELRLIDTEKITLLDDKRMTIESQITWRVIDPILHKGTVGDIDTSETRIKDLYSVTLLNIVSAKTEEEVLMSLHDEIGKNILNELNGSILKKHFGIEIISLTLKKL